MATKKKKSSKKKGKRKGKKASGAAIAAGFAKRKPTGKMPKNRRRKKAAKSVSHSLSKGSKGTMKKRRGGKRMSTKVKVGRVGAKVSCPAGSTLITSSVTRKKKDPKTGKVKKFTYIAGQCVMI